MKNVLIAIFLLAAVSLNATITIDMDDSTLKQRILQVYSEKKPQIPAAVTEEKVDEMLLFAKEYIRTNKEQEYIQELEYIIAGYLASQYVTSYLDRQSIEIEEEVIRSYYNANLQKFTTPETYDYITVRFKSKAEAKDYVQKYTKKKYGLLDMIANRDIVRSDDYRAELLPQDIKSTLESLERLELSSPFRFEDRYVVLFYTAHKAQSYKQFKEVQGQIRKMLANKKRTELINEEIERLRAR